MLSTVPEEMTGGACLWHVCSQPGQLHPGTTSWWVRGRDRAALDSFMQDGHIWQSLSQLRKDHASSASPPAPFVVLQNLSVFHFEHNPLKLHYKILHYKNTRVAQLNTQDEK